MNPNFSCPVIENAQKAFTLSKDLSRAMRRLRRSLNRCKTCPYTDCPAILQLNQQIRSAIEDLADEWHLNE